MPPSHHPPRTAPLYHMLGLPPVKTCRQFRRARLENLRKGNSRLPHIEPLPIMHHRLLRVKRLFEPFSNKDFHPQKAIFINPANTTSCGRTSKVFHSKKFLSTPIHKPRHNPYRQGLVAGKYPGCWGLGNPPPAHGFCCCKRCRAASTFSFSVR